ncbi:PAS domain-containing sensor histidine kinase [Fodinibius halophilus]|uniref:histidine kinase n=1 Tax=Fodinibius halophilus TaxID=1736908 RepID=A0A6M1T6G7_9BACT|nr:PAS domain S-box protein [Fodinibius halophilus]NGP88895.1 PAS domain S-box protein [Fodinibius halophilus]
MTLSKIPLDFEENSIPMIIYDESQSIVEVNKEACELYGFDREKLLSMNLVDLETGEQVPERLENFERQQAKYRADFWEHETKAGESIMVDILTQPVSYEGESQVLAIVQDVTTLGEKEFRDQVFQKILTCLQENLPALFYLFDAEGNLKQWNSYVEDTSGYSYAEISNMKTTDFFAREEEGEVIRAINEMFKHGESELKTKLSSKGGEKAPILFRAVKVKYEGQVLGMGIGLNLTNVVEAEKEAEHHRRILEAVIDQSPSLMYIKDEENRFRFANQAFLNLHGLDRDEIIGKKDAEVLTEYDIKLMRKTDRRVCRTGEMYNRQEEVRVNGEKRTYLSSKLQLSGIEGYENYLFGMSTDITRQKNMEKILKKSLRQKEVLLSEVHHRVKNNLAVISALMELEVLDSDNDKLQKKLNRNLSRIKTIAFIHEILYQEQDFSKIEFGINIDGLVETILAVNKEDIEIEYDIEEVKMNINQALPCSLIINEVLMNVVEYTYSINEKIFLEVGICEKDGTVYLNINDRGNTISDVISTESLDCIGRQLIATLKKQINGSINFLQQEGEGSLVELSLKKEDIKGTGSSLLEYQQMKFEN